MSAQTIKYKGKLYGLYLEFPTRKTAMSRGKAVANELYPGKEVLIKRVGKFWNIYIPKSGKYWEMGPAVTNGKFYKNPCSRQRNPPKHNKIYISFDKLHKQVSPKLSYKNIRLHGYIDGSSYAFEMLRIFDKKEKAAKETILHIKELIKQ